MHLMKLRSIFGKDKNIIIGAIHLPPLLGYKEFPGLDVAIENALADLRAFERGGVDAVIFENNYDVPHKIQVDASTISSMVVIGQELIKATHMPVGINVLWNDYRAALSIAKTAGLKFIRIPVFVDKVRTSYGVATGNPAEVQAYRKLIKADNIAIFTDIHVKHSTILSKHTISASANLAIKGGADALILTGKWTGDAPSMKELQSLRKTIKRFPILIGSGLDKTNVSELFDYADGAIVSTSLKVGNVKVGEVNVKGYSQRIERLKVVELLKAAKKKGK